MLSGRVATAPPARSANVPPLSIPTRHCAHSSSYAAWGRVGPCRNVATPVRAADAVSTVSTVGSQPGQELQDACEPGTVPLDTPLQQQEPCPTQRQPQHFPSIVEEPPQQAAAMQALEVQVAELRALVTQQQEMLQTQQKLIEQLSVKQYEGQGPLTPPLANTWGGVAGSTVMQQAKVSPFDAQRVAYGDRRYIGMYDARFHSTSRGATPEDFRVLPERIILVRHAESEGNVNNIAYTYIPDSQVPLTAKGHQQAREAGRKIKDMLECGGDRDSRLFFYLSPYKRSLQTYEGISSAFTSDRIMGVQEEVQLREQDFGNFQDQEGKAREKAERLRFGRFYYRFPNGESGADVYDRITIFEDHMIRDINAGRFSNNTNLVLVTHGLALRVFLMRWLHWTVDEFLSVYNPGNAQPLVMERISKNAGRYSWMHTKALYRLTPESREMLRGCSEEMCSTSLLPRETPPPSYKSEGLPASAAPRMVAGSRMGGTTAGGSV